MYTVNKKSERITPEERKQQRVRDKLHEGTPLAKKKTLNELVSAKPLVGVKLAAGVEPLIINEEIKRLYAHNARLRRRWDRIEERDIKLRCRTKGNLTDAQYEAITEERKELARLKFEAKEQIKRNEEFITLIRKKVKQDKYIAKTDTPAIAPDSHLAPNNLPKFELPEIGSKYSIDRENSTKLYVALKDGRIFKREDWIAFKKSEWHQNVGKNKRKESKLAGITFLVTEEQKQELIKQAEGKPLAQLIRSKLGLPETL